MESQDDPEDRIRELERPLADAARASEMGDAPQGGHGYPPPPPGAVPPPPPPMYGYGGPYAGPAPKPPSGNAMWWILARSSSSACWLLWAASRPLPHTNSPVFGRTAPPRPTTTPVATSPRTTTRHPEVVNRSDPQIRPIAPRPTADRRAAGRRVRHQREPDDRLQRQRGHRQRDFQHDVTHRPLREPDGIRHEELGHRRCRRHHRGIRPQQPGDVSLGLAEDHQVRGRQRRHAGLTCVSRTSIASACAR